MRVVFDVTGYLEGGHIYVLIYASDMGLVSGVLEQ
jgi:hypothetical protein